MRKQSLLITVACVAATLGFRLSYANASQSVVGGASVSSAAASGVNAAAISSALASANYINLRNSVIDTGLIAPLYKLRNNEPIFISGTATTANLQKLKSLVSKIHLSGLNSEDYWNSELELLSNQISDSTFALQAELLAAQSLVNIASDISTGRTALRAIDLETDFKKATFAEYQTLSQVIDSSDWLSSLSQLEPQQDQYVQLKQVLAKLYSVKSSGGWKSISGVAALKTGSSSADAIGVRQRLADLNYLPESERNKASNLVDSKLAAAIKLFQSGMKLQADGVCGKGCFAELKTSIDKRISQIGLNLERWRWLPKNLGKKYVFVNLARQELRVWENGSIVLAMNTVNGRLLRRTPTMTDRIYEVLVNPFWTVPDSIAYKDLIPSQRKDPNYMNSVEVRVYSKGVQIDPATVDWTTIGRNIPYTFRQDPGPHNSLGTVKFSLTNARSIYLHDTPHHDDFPNTTRLKSSGCVRLEKPHDLANYLLQGTEFTPDKLDYMYQNWQTYPAYSIRLAQAVPVYLTYLTASIGEQGEVRFSPDYYGQDERLLNGAKIKDGF